MDELITGHEFKPYADIPDLCVAELPASGDTCNRHRDEHVNGLWRDAYNIAWIGASNPRGVERTLAQHTETYGPDHVAVRAIRGHLEFLKGNGLGPESDDLTTVRDTWEWMSGKRVIDSAELTADQVLRLVPDSSRTYTSADIKAALRDYYPDAEIR